MLARKRIENLIQISRMDQPSLADCSLNLSQLFLDDNYSIESFLALSKENNLSLSQLRDTLRRHQQDLNQTSLELFNNSYDRFYKLSYLISCLADPIQRLVDPLETFRNQLATLCHNHDDYVKEIGNKLNSLEEANRNKALAKRIILLIKRRNRIEKQIETIDWSVRAVNRSSPITDNINSSRQPTTDSIRNNCNPTESIHYKIKCDLLERVNVELFHLTSEVSAIQPTNSELIIIKRSLQSSLNERQAQLDTWFEGAFLESIELQDKPLIDLILRTYKQKDSTLKLDSVWRNKVVKPYLALTLVESQQQLPSQQQLKRTYELLIQFIMRQLELINVDFMVKSFWDEVVESLDKLERVYSLNELDSFQARYNETCSFLIKQNLFIARDADGGGSLSRFTNNEAQLNRNRILKKFNLKGYFNHRLSQVASSIESSFSNQPLSEITIPHESKEQQQQQQQNLGLSMGFKLRICLHIYTMITKCWSSEIYIEALETSFCQLACRIINRFAEWLSKLRLSDFRITGISAPENYRQTNFLAKQDAIMRLLIEDCGTLTTVINSFFDTLTFKNETLRDIRKELISNSLNEFDNGLNNVRSLQRLIER